MDSDKVFGDEVAYPATLEADLVQLKPYAY